MFIDVDSLFPCPETLLRSFKMFWERKCGLNLVGKMWSAHDSVKLAAPLAIHFPKCCPTTIGCSHPVARHEIHQPRFCFACHQRIGRWRWWRPRLQLDSSAWADEALGRGGATLWRPHAAHGVPCGRLGSLLQGIGSYTRAIHSYIILWDLMIYYDILYYAVILLLDYNILAKILRRS